MNEVENHVTIMTLVGYRTKKAHSKTKQQYLPKQITKKKAIVSHDESAIGLVEIK